MVIAPPTIAGLDALVAGLGEVAEWSIAPHSKCGVRASVPGVRIPPSPPLQNRTANAGRSRLYAGRGGQRLKQIALGADDAHLAIRDLDPLDERAEVVAAVAAAVDPDALARRLGEPLDHLRCDRLLG